ncbi:MAG: 3-deoxy-D-manno-octulosonic acid transferase [Terriglobales bacterium]
MYLLYSALAGVALLLSSPVWLFRLLRYSKYRAGLAERLGRVPQRLRDSQHRPTIWVHAVSVGEVLAVSGLISELQQRVPSHRIAVSTTTATGQNLARDRFGAADVFYFPIDFAFAVRPYLRALRPELIVIAETEFWPNFLRLGRQSGARIAVVNARISDRSLPRYRRFHALIAPALRNIDLFLAQGDEDRRRLIEIGAPAKRVQVSGNLKFDLKPASEAPLVAELKSALANTGPVLVCGSTVEGEEPILLRAFTVVRERYPNALMILAPRHPERFAQVAELIAASGIKFWRRSRWNASEPLGAGIFLLDTIGELASLYQLADIAFVGGSLVAKGGHNILEAAQHGAAIVVGPHTENFRDMVTLFRRAGAVVVATADELAQTFLGLLADESRCRGVGARAREILRDNSGATARTVSALQSLLVKYPVSAADRAAAPKISPRMET